MPTLFGLPLFGSFFTPTIIITILSIFVYKTFFKITEGDIREPYTSDKVHQVKFTDAVQVNEKQKKKKKKSCGKKGGTNCCSTKTGSIDNTKVFIESSSCTKDLGQFVVGLWKKESLNVDVLTLNTANLELQLKNEQCDLSLCVFLLDKKEERPVLRPWLEKTSKEPSVKSDILSGLKYSVFIANSSEGDTTHQETDRALHKLGGVRVCKAGMQEFSVWCDHLLLTVSKWNQSGKKACKCGPGNANENEEEHSSCGGSCSSSEDETLSSSVLDLEDLGKALS